MLVGTTLPSLLPIMLLLTRSVVKLKVTIKDLLIAFIQLNKSINDHNVDGLSITLGNPRKHVWTYAVGISDDGDYPNYNCPCAAVPKPDPPAFVGNHYYCESGNTGTFSSIDYHTEDVLWDGYGCHHPNNNCCTNPDMPWFFQQFLHPMQDYLEARICYIHAFDDDDTLVESIELYIQ